MTPDEIEMMLRLVTAMVAGTIIGYERSFHGRPAGIRTHALVCMASSILMIVTVYEAHWVRSAVESIRLDPTRMAQGIMTGIGFLGAGVIVREGLSIRGLTTAASIWITATIGVLAGIGMYFPLLASVVLTLGVLAVFRGIESRIPSQTYYHFDVRFPRAEKIREAELRTLVEGHGFCIANASLRVERKGQVRRHSMMLFTLDRTNASRLSESLDAMDRILEFRLVPSGDE